MSKDKTSIAEKFTLIPTALVQDKDKAAERALNDLFSLEKEEKAAWHLSSDGSKIIAYAVPATSTAAQSTSTAGTPLAAELLNRLEALADHNKLIISLLQIEETAKEKILFVGLQEGTKLITLNSHRVTDFNTALFYILATLRSAQMNPSQTKVRILNSKLEYNQLERLGQYFKRAEII